VFECTKCSEKWYNHLHPITCDKYTYLTVKTPLKIAYVKGSKLSLEELNKIREKIDMSSASGLLSNFGINSPKTYKIKDRYYEVPYEKLCINGKY